METALYFPYRHFPEIALQLLLISPLPDCHQLLSASTWCYIVLVVMQMHLLPQAHHSAAVLPILFPILFLQQLLPSKLPFPLPHSSCNIFPSRCSRVLAIQGLGKVNVWTGEGCVQYCQCQCQSQVFNNHG